MRAKVEVVGRMGDVPRTRYAAPVGQLQQQVERMVLWLRPDGWQARARRNAWSAMVADSRRRQSRQLAARDLPASDAHPAITGTPAKAVRAR